ncbi:MAG TPA: dodecin family protein [Desulfobacteria bacterium]|nr:dodecin family protein [Desulfobacteria bacterium]
MDVVKVTELIGESSHNWNEAVHNAVKKASQSVSNITGVEVYNLTAGVRNGELIEYKANVKVAYKD